MYLKLSLNFLTQQFLQKQEDCVKRITCVIIQIRGLPGLHVVKMNVLKYICFILAAGCAVSGGVALGTGISLLPSIKFLLYEGL